MIYTHNSNTTTQQQTVLLWKPILAKKVIKENITKMIEVALGYDKRK